MSECQHCKETIKGVLLKMRQRLNEDGWKTPDCTVIDALINEMDAVSDAEKCQAELAKYKRAVDVLNKGLDEVSNHKSNPHKSYMVEVCELRRIARDAEDEAKKILSGEQP